MKIISIEQKSSEWIEWRKTKVTATDAACILGINPYKTAYKLWLQKLGYGDEFYINDAMRKGLELEPHARALFEEQSGIIVTPTCIESSEYSWAGASLDGLSEDCKTLIEIKVSGDTIHDKVKLGIISPLYFAQIQHQLMCAELNEAIYFSFNGLEGIQVKIYRDEAYIKNMIEKEKEFWEHVQNLEAPTVCDKDFHEINSETFNNLSKEYLRIKHAKDILTIQEGEVRDQLLAYTQNGNVKNNHISIERIVSKGRVEYKKIPELSNVNLDQFRSPATSSWRILSI